MAAKPKKITLVVSNDFGTEGLHRHLDTYLEKPDPNDRASDRTRVTDAIDWYEKRHYLTPSQADALRRFRDDSYLAGAMPSCTQNLQPRIMGGTSELSDAMVAAKKRRDHAIKVLTEYLHLVAVEKVACEGITIGRYFLNRYGMSPHEALDVLYKALNKLCVHYGFTNNRA